MESTAESASSPMMPSPPNNSLPPPPPPPLQQQQQQQQQLLPPGFRFHPTDEELLIHYLRKKAASVPLPVPIIADIDLYKFDPWELPGMASFGEHEWYFFSQRDRKYPNGARPNRAATSGYWKATGTDKPVMSTTLQQGGRRHKLGVKKALVFYGGKPPKGIKTNWIMHEYRLAANANSNANANAAHNNNINRNYDVYSSSSSNRPPTPHCFHPSNNKKPLSLRLDDWVLCRIYHKNNNNSPTLGHQLAAAASSQNQRHHHHHLHDHAASSSLPIPPGLALPPAPSTISTGNYLFQGPPAAAAGPHFTRFPSTSALNTTELAAATAVPMKRTFPFLYWSSATRFHELEDYNNNAEEEEGENSNNGTSSNINHTTLLNYTHEIQAQSPSSSSQQQQQAMLGSINIGTGVLQLPRVNSWPYTN